MGIVFKNLNWKVNGFSLNEIFVTNDASTIVLKDHMFESILGFNSNDWTISELITEDKNPGMHFIDLSGDLFKICREGCVFKLEKKINSQNAIFGSDSSISEASSWTKISAPLGHIVKLAATSTGFAAIVNTEGFFFLKLFTVQTDSVSLQATARLPISSKIETNWLISRIRKLSPDFIKHVFKEVSLVSTDVVLVSCPNGFILLYAVMNNCKFSNPVPIFWDSEVVSSVEATPCGQALLLFFTSGKIVFVVMRKSIIKYSVHYLSSRVIGAAIVSSGAQFHVIWSDSVKLFYFGPVDLDNLLIKEFESPVKGITCLSAIGSSALAGNINKNFYQISFNNSENISATSGLKNLPDVGNEVEKLKNELVVVNNHFEALQADGSKIVSKVSGREISLENMGSSIFRKDVWELEIESSLNDVHFVSKFAFNQDFGPNCVLKFPVGCCFSEQLDVRLVGNVGGKKLLILNLPSVNMGATKSDNVFDELKTILNL